MKLPPLTGLVLSGGTSRRMGKDKALLSFEGKTLLERACETLNGFCDPVLIASGNPAHQWKSARRIEDAAPEKGPLAGLVAGLRASETDWLAVLACDFPLINQDFYQVLWDLRKGNSGILVFQEAKRLQPLCGFYHRKILPGLENALAHNRLSLQQVLVDLESEFPGLPPALLSANPSIFTNLNSPEDLKMMKRNAKN